MSPFYTLYGAGLLILQYLTGFKISFDQLNFTYDRITMEQIGLKIEDYQPEFVPLLIKVSNENIIFVIKLRFSFDFSRST